MAPTRIWRYAPLLFGAAGVGVVALGLLAPWTIAIVGAAIILALAFAESEPFLLLCIFFLPVNVVLAGDFQLHDLGVAMRMLVVVGFFAGKLSRRELNLKLLWRPGFTRASALFLGAVILSAVLGNSGERRASLRGVYFITLYILFYLMVYVWVNSRERLRKFLVTLMASAIAVCAFAFYQFVTGGFTKLWLTMYASTNPNDSVWSDRPASVLGHANHLSAFLNIMLSLALGCFVLAKDRHWKQISGCLLFSGTIALALTQSRGGAAAYCVILLLAIWSFAEGRRKRLILTVGLIAFLVAGVALAAEFGPKRLQTEGDNSLMERIILWGVAVQIFQSSPVHGVGFGAFELINGRYLPQIPGMEEDLGAHNLYLELLAETGIIGLGSFCVLMLTCLRQGWSQQGNGDWLHRAVAFTVFAGGIGMMVDSLAEHTLFWAMQVGCLFWLFPGLLLASSRLNESGTIDEYTGSGPRASVSGRALD